jgi:hypothetical protein
MTGERQKTEEQKLIEANSRLNPRGEIAKYLGFLARAAGFNFQSDEDMADNHFRYVIDGEFPYEIQEGKGVLGFKTRDVLCGNMDGGKNRILDRWDSVLHDGQKFTAQIVSGCLHKIFMGRFSEYELDRMNPQFRQVSNLIRRAEASVMANFPELSLLADAPGYYSLKTYKGNPRLIPQELEQEMEKMIQMRKDMGGKQ